MCVCGRSLGAGRGVLRIWRPVGISGHPPLQGYKRLQARTEARPPRRHEAVVVGLGLVRLPAARRHAEHAAEVPREVALVREAGRGGDFGNGCARAQRPERTL